MPEIADLLSVGPPRKTAILDGRINFDCDPRHQNVHWKPGHLYSAWCPNCGEPISHEWKWRSIAWNADDARVTALASHTVACCYNCAEEPYTSWGGGTRLIYIPSLAALVRMAYRADRPWDERR